MRENQEERELQEEGNEHSCFYPKVNTPSKCSFGKGFNFFVKKNDKKLAKRGRRKKESGEERLRTDMLDQDSPWAIDGKQVTMDKRLGAGQFGVVYAGNYLGAPVAVKRLLYTDQSPQVMLKYIQREVPYTLYHYNNSKNIIILVITVQLAIQINTQLILFFITTIIIILINLSYCIYPLSIRSPIQSSPPPPSSPFSNTQQIAAISQLKHPNVIQFLGMFLKDNDIFLVTEWAEGGDVSAKLEDPAWYLSWKLRAGIMRDVARAMTYLHAKGFN